MNLSCPINDSLKIQFETDAANNYFNERVGNGEIEFSHPSLVSYRRLLNGIYTIVIKPEKSESKLEVGDTVPFSVRVLHNDKETFKENLTIEITDEITKPQGPAGPGPGPGPGPIPPEPYDRTKRQKNDDAKGANIDPPRLEGLSKEEDEEKWMDLFKGNEKRGACFTKSGKKIKGIINTSHPQLKTYRAKNRTVRPEKIAQRFINYVGLTSYGIYLLHESGLIKFELNDKFTITDLMNAVSDSVAFFGLDFADKVRKS